MSAAPEKSGALDTSAPVSDVGPVKAAPPAAQFSVASPKGTAVFQADWKNFAEHYQIPDWFRDAKFGIFIHWGVYSVPAFGSEWYPRNMYVEGSSVYKHHLKTYGPQTKFGYKDFVPLFKAEKFDASEWAALFKASGAKYVVPVAEHHDGFSMYASDRNPWNAVAMGPKRDILGELKKSIEGAGLVFGLSSHRLENSFFFNGGLKFPSDVQDRSISLYGFRLPGGTRDAPYDDAVEADFLAHTKELIDKYQPALIWFDWSVDRIMPSFNKFLAYYYNNARDWGRGVVVNTKKGFPNNVQVSDVERGSRDVLQKYPWQTDTSIGRRSWSHVKGESNKSAGQIIHSLVDIVSKNGNLLLNIGPKADGTITEAQKNVLLEIGEWLKINGDAIYGTRPWYRYGEGAARGNVGTFSDGNATKYAVSDLRFTTKANTLYVLLLNHGENILVKSLAPEVLGKSKLLSATLLGTDSKLETAATAEGLSIRLPKAPAGKHAWAIRLEFDVLPMGKSEAVDKAFKHTGS
ncbi:MAG: alpha-L-fucosidase [Puniceicoccales bacterium]|nr:alpha-L-fucosidase [Puniceicoccales bacterium]